MRPPVGKDWQDYYRRFYVAFSFGAKASYGYHEGDDINLNTGGDSDLGENIYAVAPWTKRYYHFNSHPDSGFGIHYVYEIQTPVGTRWVHCCHNMPNPAISNKTSGNEGDLLSQIGKSGRPRKILPAHLHFAIFKVDPKTLRDGIDTIARNKTELYAWWENPLEFLRKYESGGSMPDLIQVERKDWERARKSMDVLKDVHDELGLGGDHIDIGSGPYKQEIQNMDKTIVQQKKEIDRLKEELENGSGPITPEPDPNVEWQLNGKTETYIRDGVTVTKNYAVKR